jgi:hypothetical protein
MKEIKIVRVPGTTTEVAVDNDGANVREVLAAAGITNVTGFTLKVNAAEATLDSSVPNGAKIYILKAVKGAVARFVALIKRILA